MDDMIEFIKPDFSFADERGALTQLCREGWKQINVTSSKAGVSAEDIITKIIKKPFT